MRDGVTGSIPWDKKQALLNYYGYSEDPVMYMAIDILSEITLRK